MGALSPPSRLRAFLVLLALVQTCAAVAMSLFIPPVQTLFSTSVVIGDGDTAVGAGFSSAPASELLLMLLATVACVLAHVTLKPHVLPPLERLVRSACVGTTRAAPYMGAAARGAARPAGRAWPGRAWKRRGLPIWC